MLVYKGTAGVEVEVRTSLKLIMRARMSAVVRWLNTSSRSCFISRLHQRAATGCARGQLTQRIENDEARDTDRWFLRACWENSHALPQ